MLIRLFLGAFTTKLLNTSILSPEFIDVPAKYEGVISFYTNTSIDVEPLVDLPTTKASFQAFYESVAAYFKRGAKQTSRIQTSSAIPFERRFNFLRANLGIDKDLNEFLDLGFEDTSRLDSLKGRAYLFQEVNKASLNVQVPLYKPYLSIKPEGVTWNELFGEVEPQMVSIIKYGGAAYLVFESDSSASDLCLAINHYLGKRVDVNISSSEAFTQLDDKDQKVLENAVAYGYEIGEGAFSHNTLEALGKYVELAIKLSDPHYMGIPISYVMNDPLDFSLFHYNIDVKVFPADKMKE